MKRPFPVFVCLDRGEAEKFPYFFQKSSFEKNILRRQGKITSPPRKKLWPRYAAFLQKKT
jgi:hypothetical protein